MRSRSIVTSCVLGVVAALALSGSVALAQGEGAQVDPEKGTLDGSPLDDLPPHITLLSYTGLRPDWSPDGKRLVILEGAPLGQAAILDVTTGRKRVVTDHFEHRGISRAYFLHNGDLLLCGPTSGPAPSPDNPAESAPGTVVAVLGPTGVGKTAVAVELASRLGLRSRFRLREVVSRHGDALEVRPCIRTHRHEEIVRDRTPALLAGSVRRRQARQRGLDLRQLDQYRDGHRRHREGHQPEQGDGSEAVPEAGTTARQPQAEKGEQDRPERRQDQRGKKLLEIEHARPRLSTSPCSGA